VWVRTFVIMANISGYALRLRRGDLIGGGGALRWRIREYDCSGTGGMASNASLNVGFLHLR